MGKYDRIVKDLPRLPVEQGEYQDRVELAKNELRRNGKLPGTAELVEHFVKLRRAKDALEEKLKALNLHVEAASQLVVAAFEAEGVASLTLGDGATVRVDVKPYSGVVDKEAFRRWCVAQGLEHDMHLWPSTTQALMNQRLLEGEGVPCAHCEATGTSEAAPDGRCPDCRGTGQQVAPGVRVFAKPTPYVTGR